MIAPALPQVLRLEGAERVTLRGLTFAHTEWTLPKDSSGFPQAAVGVPGAVWLNVRGSARSSNALSLTSAITHSNLATATRAIAWPAAR